MVQEGCWAGTPIPCNFAVLQHFKIIVLKTASSSEIHGQIAEKGAKILRAIRELAKFEHYKLIVSCSAHETIMKKKIN